MAKIRKLPEELVNQIAAGEVVERPASVVKELVENSLDAGATRIDVSITHGGLRWICVTDNGTGMSRDDAALALLPHATSKIGSFDDLLRVSTLGFRGEALPSIASVAELRLRTRTTESSVGAEVRTDPPSPPKVSDVSCPVGTRVEVHELFSKVPARRKFLRSAATESGHIARGLERLALARPELRLALERDGRAALAFLATSEPRERVIAVLPGVGESLLSFDGQSDGLRAWGFTSPTDVTRAHSNDVHLFVNRRPVRDRQLLFAVRDAYRDALPPGRYPIAVLYLEIPPDLVDVNVHPAKAEVRFRDADHVRRLVAQSIGVKLGHAPRAFSSASVWSAPGLRIGEPVAAPQLWLGTRTTSSDTLVDESPALAQAEHVRDGANSPRIGAEIGAPRPVLPFAQHRYLGQLLATYLVLEGPEGMVLIDQHAAHERVLFEELRAAWTSGAIARQPLLIPVGIELSSRQVEALETERTALVHAGFEIEPGGPGIRGGVRVEIKAVPAVLLGRGARLDPFSSASRQRSQDWPALIEETADALLDGSGERSGIAAAAHAALASAACHSACRKGDRLEVAEVQALLATLDAQLWIPCCPHGRPVYQLLTAGELERRFLRS